MGIKIGSVETYGIIYKIHNKINDKIYIGQTINKNGFNGRYSSKGNGIEKVYNYYKRSLKYNYRINKHLFNAIDKYGYDAFEVNEIFDIAFSRNELDIKEQCWINILKANKYNNGYNIQEGGFDYKTVHNSIRKYSNNEIVKAKEMIVKNIYTDKEISNVTNVNEKTIYFIRQGNVWNDVGSELNETIKEIYLGKYLSRNFNIETYANEINHMYSNGSNYLEIYDNLNNKYFKSNKDKPIKRIYEEIRRFCILIKRKSQGRSVKICECCNKEFIVSENNKRKKHPKYCKKCAVKRNNIKNQKK